MPIKGIGTCAAPTKVGKNPRINFHRRGAKAQRSENKERVARSCAPFSTTPRFLHGNINHDINIQK